MPTYQKTLTGTPQKIVEANSQRTALTFANRDDTDPGYYSDDQGNGITRDNSFPIFPETHQSLERPADEPQKAYWGICEAGKTVVIAIMEAFGDMGAPMPQPEPSPQDPIKRIDAPLMRRRHGGTL